MSDTIASRSDRGAARLEKAAYALALLGGTLMLGLAGLVTLSVVLRWFGSGGVAGDFELVQMLTALAVFCFLPLCQLRRGHIVVDAFTARAPAPVRGGLDRGWALLAALVFGLLAWRLAEGGLDAVANRTVSMVLSLPTGWVIVVCAALSGLIALAALVTAWQPAGRDPVVR